MIIQDIRLFEVHGTWTAGGRSEGARSARALDAYAEFNEYQPEAREYPEPREVKEIFVEIRSDEGTTGLFGPIDHDQAHVIRAHLRDFLIGRDPLATALLQDQMIRLNRHGRTGLFMTGVSAIDCALWDLKGKALGQPVCRLLGGPTRGHVPAYASMLGFSLEPQKATEAALRMKEDGFTAQKWFFRHGPADGAEGLRRNLELVKALREAVGEFYPLMFDAFSGWDLRYATEMARAMEPYNPAWLEEPLPPERIGAFRQLKQSAYVPLATGEHVYTRWQAKELLTAGAVDILQNDPDWTGGITELQKICALGSASEVPVIAHGHSLLAALHVAGAESPATVPYVEYLIRHQDWKQFFFRDPVRPKNGLVRVPTAPGLGLELDLSKVETTSDRSFQITH